MSFWDSRIVHNFITKRLLSLNNEPIVLIVKLLLRFI